MKYLKVKEVAERLGVHENTVLKWLADGTLHGVRFGRLWRIPDSEVERVNGERLMEEKW